MGTKGTEETARLCNVHRVRNGTQWASTLRLKKNTEAFTKYSFTKCGRFQVGTFPTQAIAGFAKNVLLYLLAKEDAAYKADFKKSQTQTQDQDVFNDPDFVADLDQANFLEVSRMLRGKAKSTQQPVPPSPASLKVVQRITEMKSRLHDSNCEIAHNLTPVQSERKTKRKKRRCNCLNSVDIHTRLEEVMGAWNAVLLSGNKHTSSDCFQKTNYVESRVPNHQLYFPSGDIAQLSLLSTASQKSLKHHYSVMTPITNDLHRANYANRRLWQRLLSGSSNSKDSLNSRTVRKYMQKLTDTLMSSSSYSNSRSRKNGNCGDDRRDDNGNGNGDGNSAINIPEELSRLLVERNSTMEDLNYYVFDSASLRDELNERLAQCLAIDPKTDNLGNKVEVNYFKTPMESLEIKRDGHNEESVLALRWADAHIKVLEFALQTSTVGLNTFSECVHFTARCIHWNAQVELAVAYDMKNWLVEVLGQEKLESDTDFFGSHRPPPDIYQPALDFSQFNSIDVAATGGDIGQGASLNSYLVWLYWGPTITAWSVRARNGRPVVCLIPEHELQEDDINYLKSIMPKLP